MESLKGEREEREGFELDEVVVGDGGVWGVIDGKVMGRRKRTLYALLGVKNEA